VVRQAVCSFLQALLEEKALQKLYQTLEQTKYTPIHICAKTAIAG
jgi:hypothetical protein